MFIVHCDKLSFHNLPLFPSLVGPPSSSLSQVTFLMDHLGRWGHEKWTTLIETLLLLRLSTSI